MSVPDPEVVPKASRRRFKTEYKVKILREADACTDPGQIGALLRREGLYSSHLTVWRRLRDQGFLVFAGERKRGRKAKPANPQAKRVAGLERENRKLEEKLRKAEIIIDFQKQVQDLLRMHDEGAPKRWPLSAPWPAMSGSPACQALRLPRATWYRRQKPKPTSRPRPAPDRALAADERSTVLSHLDSERSDSAPSEALLSWARGFLRGCTEGIRR